MSAVTQPTQGHSKRVVNYYYNGEQQDQLYFLPKKLSVKGGFPKFTTSPRQLTLQHGYSEKFIRFIRTG